MFISLSAISSAIFTKIRCHTDFQYPGAVAQRLYLPFNRPIFGKRVALSWKVSSKFSSRTEFNCQLSDLSKCCYPLSSTISLMRFSSFSFCTQSLVSTSFALHHITHVIPPTTAIILDRSNYENIQCIKYLLKIFREKSPKICRRQVSCLNSIA